MVFVICICDFFCIVVLDEGLGLQGPQDYMVVVVCPRCRDDGTPAYVGVSRVCVVGPFLISLGFPLFLFVMKGGVGWWDRFWVELLQGSFQLR